MWLKAPHAWGPGAGTPRKCRVRAGQQTGRAKVFSNCVTQPRSPKTAVQKEVAHGHIRGIWPHCRSPAPQLIASPTAQFYVRLELTVRNTTIKYNERSRETTWHRRAIRNAADSQSRFRNEHTVKRTTEPGSTGDIDLGTDILCCIYFSSKILYLSQLLETERLKHRD